MHKLFIFLIACLAAFSALQAKNLNPEQRKLQSEIEKFIREEGFVPEANELGNLVFKKEGETYTVSIDERDTSPFFVYLEQYFSYSGYFTRENITANLARLNLEKGVKLVLFDESYCYSTGMYLVDSEAFKYAFYRLIERIDGVRSVTDSLCKNGKTASAPAATGSIARFFPLHGITLHATSISDLERMGHQVYDKEQKHPYSTVQGLNFWDFDNDGYIDQVFFDRESDIPEAWKAIFGGLDFSASYNQWLTALSRLGYEPELLEKTSVKKEEGRKTLHGCIKAVSTDRKLAFYFYFEGGNQAG